MEDQQLIDAYWETQKADYSPRYLERLTPEQLQQAKESYVGTINFELFKLSYKLKHELNTLRWNRTLPMN